MIKNTRNKKKNIFLKGIFGNFNIYFIDYKLKFQKKIKLKSIKNINIFFFKKYLLLNIDLSYKVSKKNKKEILNLYKSLIFQKIKGLLQKFKMYLYLNGIGFKFFIKNNFLILKIGYSHNIFIKIPKKIFIKQLNNNQLILKSNNLEFLTKFIFFIKKFKKTNIYKKKGIFLKNEKIIIKEGKKNKK